MMTEDILQKGFAYVVVEAKADCFYRITFQDMFCFAQSVEESFKQGRVCYGPEEDVILREFSIDNVTAAVKELWASKYFNYLVPIPKDSPSIAPYYLL